jgi:NTE family protein
MILSLSGGGLNGLAYLGLFRFLESKNLDSNQFMIYGTSIGGIFGALWGMGFDSETIIRLFSKYLFHPEANIKNFFENGGLDDGQKLDEIFKTVIKYKYDPNVTLVNFKNIYLCVCNLKQNEIIYLSHETFPDMPVYLAMRMTCNLPFIFQPIHYKNYIFVDGGILENVPLPPNFDEPIIFCKFESKTDNFDENGNYYQKILSFAGMDKFNFIIKYINKIYINNIILDLPKPFQVYDFWMSVEEKNLQILNSFIFCKKNEMLNVFIEKFSKFNLTSKNSS